MNKTSCFFLSLLLFLSSYGFFNFDKACAIDQTLELEVSQDEHDIDEELNKLFEDPELLDQYIKEYEDANDKEDSFFSFIMKKPEWVMAVQEWFDSEVISRYSEDEREKVLEKLVVLDSYIRKYSGERLSLITVAPVLIIGSSAACATFVMYCLICCCRGKRAKPEPKLL